MSVSVPTETLDDRILLHLIAMKSSGAFNEQPSLPWAVLSRLRYRETDDPQEMTDPAQRIKGHFHCFPGSDNEDLAAMIQGNAIVDLPSEIKKRQFDSWFTFFDAAYTNSHLFYSFLHTELEQTCSQIKFEAVPLFVKEYDPFLIPPSSAQARTLSSEPVDTMRCNSEGAKGALTDNETAWVLHVLAEQPIVALTFLQMRETIKNFNNALVKVAANYADQDDRIASADLNRLRIATQHINSSLDGPAWARMIMARFCLLYVGRVKGDTDQPVEAQDFRALIDYLRTNNFHGQAEQIDHGLRHKFHCPFHAFFNVITGCGKNLAAIHDAFVGIEQSAHVPLQVIRFANHAAKRQFCIDGGQAGDFLPPLLDQSPAHKRPQRLGRCPHAHAE